MKRKVLIITYNGYHQLIAEAILKLDDISKDSYIIDQHLTFSENLSNYKNYMPSSNNNFIKFFQVAKLRFNIKLLIKKKLIDEVIIPHSEGVLSNLLYSQYNNSYKLSFYHEGILSFYHFERGERNWFRIRKHLAPYLFFYKFKKYDNLFDINNEKVFKFYTPIVSENLTINNFEKIEKIELNNFKFRGKDKYDALLLGAPLNNCTDNQILDIFKKINEVLSTNNVYSIAYKPHPLEKNVALRTLISRDYKLTELEKRIPIEEHTSKILPKIILSFNSSAVISLKLSNQEKDFYCFSDGREMKPELYDYFFSIGIICDLQ